MVKRLCLLAGRQNNFLKFAAPTHPVRGVNRLRARGVPAFSLRGNGERRFDSRRPVVHESPGKEILCRGHPGSSPARNFDDFFTSMLTELLQDRAALYVSGAMTAAERENFELILEFHAPLRAQVAALQEVGASVLMAGVKHAPRVNALLKDRLLGALDSHPRQLQPDGIVVTGPDCCIEWVNSAFTAMCGYTLEEIKGRKPGHFLQGPDTDPASVQRIREALNERRACQEVLVNYHKCGRAYRVDIAIAPILDDAGAPLWFVAREKELPAS
jgi:PAS domain S-box-containing protein